MGEDGCVIVAHSDEGHGSGSEAMELFDVEGQEVELAAPHVVEDREAFERAWDEEGFARPRPTFGP